MTLHTIAIKIAAPFVLVAGWAAPSLAEPPAFGGSKMLIHGNYCGPGNNAPSAPIDALDAACARHDACTPYNALPTKAFNLRLEREATVIASDPRQPQNVRSMAGFVAAFASAAPSKPTSYAVLSRRRHRGV